MAPHRKSSHGEYNFKDLESSTYPQQNDMPSCTRHPRWITLGFILFSVMLSCSVFMTKNWRPYSEFMEMDQEWQWPDMDPWKIIIQDDPEAGRFLTTNPAEPSIVKTNDETQDTIEHVFTTENSGPSTGNYRPKTWDVNDPALTLTALFSSEEWTNQSLAPSSDFINLLRILRPVDHAFFTTLFMNQLPSRREAAHKDSQEYSPTHSLADNNYGCGTWISNYTEIQKVILDGAQQSRYLLHTCPMISSTTDYGTSGFIPTSEPLQQQQQQQQQIQPCGDLFSQMLAMTTSFAWSVIESRGFFLNLDQLQGLQESFEQSLLQHWTPPPNTKDRIKINTSDMLTRDIDSLFRLDDPLLNYQPGDRDDSNQATNEEFIYKQRIRSKSRNRVSFERTIVSNEGQKVDRLTAEKLVSELNQDKVELILNHDLLPQIVNTSRTFNQLFNLNLPLPDHLLQQRQQKPTEKISGNIHSKTPTVHAPYAHGSLFGSAPLSPLSLSSNSANELSTSRAFHTATHDERDPSRVQAVPKTFGCLLDTLIQPKLELKELIHPYATLFKLPAIFSVGIFIQSTQTTHESASRRSILDDRKATVDRYMTCARQIAREFAPKRKGQKIVFVVVSEDKELAKMMESQEEWDEEVITPKWIHPKNTRQQHHQQHQSEPTISTRQQAVLENWILSKTDFQVVSDYSNFAKVAVWRTRREGRSIVIRENPEIEKEMMTESGHVDMLDCGMLLKNIIVTD